MLLFFVNQINFNLQFSTFVLIYLVAVLANFAFLYVAKGLRHLEISSAIPLLSFGPAVVAIISWIFLGESLNGVKISGIFLIMIGSYILEIDHKISDLKEPIKKIIKSRYIHFIFAALFLFAITVTLDRYILSNLKLNIDFISYFFFIALFVMINYLIVTGIFLKRFSSVKRTLKLNWKWLFLTALFGVLGHSFYYKAVSIQLISLVYPIHKINSLVSILIGGELFHEHKLVLKTIATLIMLIGGYLIIL